MVRLMPPSIAQRRTAAPRMRIAKWARWTNRRRARLPSTGKTHSIAIATVVCGPARAADRLGQMIVRVLVNDDRRAVVGGRHARE